MTLPQGSETVSSWMTSVEMPTTHPLDMNKDVDVCIVGAGIAGITTAYMMMRAGKRVCVLEAGELGSGQTGKTTAHITTSLDDQYVKLEKLFNRDEIRLIAKGQQTALDWIEHIVRIEKIDCDFEKVPGYLIRGQNPDKEIIEKELVAAQNAGLQNLAILSHAPGIEFDTGPSLCFADQIQLQPLKYLKGLIEILIREGVEIHTKSSVIEVKSGLPTYVRTFSGFRVNAHSIVVATNAPINEVKSVHMKQAPYRTYVIGLLVPKKSIKKALYWDAEEPYHYARIAEENDLYDVLIVGGEDHKTGQNYDPQSGFRRLEKWARRHFPMAQNIFYRWSGQIMEPIDGIAFMGRSSEQEENIYIITGDSGDGMTQFTLGAMIVSDLIEGLENEWAHLYSPSRTTIRALGRYFKENVNVIQQYSHWLTGEGMGELPSLMRGEGMVVNRGLQKIAVYRHYDGFLEMRSAACTHMGCVVAWNSVEKSWDCPCHGSRYDCHGNVIEGPAKEPLRLVDSLYYPATDPVIST